MKNLRVKELVVAASVFVEMLELLIYWRRAEIKSFIVWCFSPDQLKGKKTQWEKKCPQLLGSYY